MEKAYINVKKEVAKGFILFLALAILRFSGQNYLAFALCFGFFVASLFCGVRVLFGCVAYLASGCFDSLEVFLWVGASCFAVLLVFAINKLTKKQVGARWFWSILFLGQIFFVLYNTAGWQILLQKLIYVFVCCLFAFASLFAIKSIFVRGLRYKLGNDEKLCISLVVVCFAMGLGNLHFGTLSVIRLVASFASLAMLYVFGNFACLMSCLLFGMGCAFGQGSLTEMAIFATWGVVAVSLKHIKPLCILSIPIADLVLKYFFMGNVISVVDVVSLLLGCVVFAVLPKNVWQSCQDKFGTNKDSYAVRNIVNRTKTNLSRKLYDLSEIFFEMKLSFSGMVKGVVPREQATVMLAKEVSQSVCQDCGQRTNCWRTHIEKTEKAFLSIMEGAMDRGKATVFDLPVGMTKDCKRLNSVLTHTNQAVERYKNYYLVTTNNDNSRLLISEQLGGVSNIMKSLSVLSKAQSSFDVEKEGILFEQLTRHGVLVKEVLVCQEASDLVVVVVVQSKDSKKECISKIVSRVCGQKMMLEQSQNTQNKNWVVLNFVVAPRFDVTFGFACQKKQDSQISGDTHTFLRIDGTKFLVGLCDGMGSGVVAEKTSSSAISLIENFYKAGFDNETILSNVNRLLTLSQEETFTAVDVAVVDLKQGLCDFIKIGGTCGFVKNMDVVEIISAGSLPLGVLEEMTPSITKKALRDGDFILLASDGVTDAFATKEDMARYIADTTFTTPQHLADVVLKKALDNQQKIAKDDMTVVVCQVFDNTK